SSLLEAMFRSGLHAISRKGVSPPRRQLPRTIRQNRLPPEELWQTNFRVDGKTEEEVRLRRAAPRSPNTGHFTNPVEVILANPRRRGFVEKTALTPAPREKHSEERAR